MHCCKISTYGRAHLCLRRPRSPTRAAPIDKSFTSSATRTRKAPAFSFHLPHHWRKRCHRHCCKCDSKHREEWGDTNRCCGCYRILLGHHCFAGHDFLTISGIKRRTCCGITPLCASGIVHLNAPLEGIVMTSISGRATDALIGHFGTTRLTSAAPFLWALLVFATIAIIRLGNLHTVTP